MRYSKAKMIMAGIITFICLIAVGFGIYKGIDYSMKLTENTDTKKDSKKALATVYKNTETKKKTTTKKTASKKKTKTTTNEKKEAVVKKENNKETKKTEEVKTQEVKETKKEDTSEFSSSKVGFYDVVSLKIKNKSYSKEDLEKLKKSGYSLELQLNDKGLATVSVLSINKMYEFTDDHFYDGEKEIAYTYKKNKLSVTIDDYEIVFEKE